MQYSIEKFGTIHLGNWCFVNPVNQRGETEYVVGTNEERATRYTIDRYILEGYATSLKVADGYIEFHPEERWSNLYQKIECGKDLAGEMVTLSVLYRAYNYKGHLFGYTNAATLNSAFKEQTDGFEMCVYTVKVPENAKTYSFRFYINGNSGVLQIKAAKLELGPVQTLAHKEGDTWVLNDPPPNRALELAKCQRYYQIFPSIETMPGGTAPTTSTPIKKEAFRPPMASDITTSKYGEITINGNTFYYADANL